MITNIKDIMPSDYKACTYIDLISKLVGFCAMGFFLSVLFYRIVNKDRLRYSGRGWTHTPTAEERRNGFHGFNIEINPWGLYIKFNAAKIIFGENISELTEYHAPMITEILKTYLTSIGIELLPDWESNFQVNYMEIAKNMLVKGIAGSHAISVLDNAKDAKGRRSFGNKTFTDGSKLLFTETKTERFTLYDKESEVQSYEARRSGGKVVSPIEFIKKIQTDKDGLVRMELTLERAAMKKYYAQFGIFNPCLSNIFNSGIAHYLLTKSWQNILFNSRVGTDTANAEFLVEKIARSEPDRKVLDVLAVLGLLSIEKTLSRIEVRKLLISHYGKQSVRYALKKLGNNISPSEKYPCGELSTIIDTINGHLEQWSPLNTMADLTPNVEAGVTEQQESK